MKIWIDDCRPAPEDYISVCSVNDAKAFIEKLESGHEEIGIDDNGYPCIKRWVFEIELIDVDHDAGIYADEGGDYIKLLDWLEETGRNYPIRIHSQNPVGVANMRAIIERNGWKEVK